jgi:hypothetical protein
MYPPAGGSLFQRFDHQCIHTQGCTTRCGPFGYRLFAGF